jgi:hypothetical protein
MKNLIFKKAFEYIVHGYSVLPINPESKLPIIKSWKNFQEEIPTEEEIEAWWKQTPKANVGIITGKVSNITVVDIDVKGDVVVPLDTFPKTFTVKTPSGGYHLYYQYDSEIKQTANTYPQFPHVDIRNDGGYVVAAPSKNSKGQYKVISNVPLAPFPRNLFITNSATSSSPQVLSKQKIAGLLRSIDKMTEGDGRNNALTRIAGKLLNMVQFNDHEAVAYPILLSTNKQFKTPLPESEVRTIFDSLHTKEARKPLATVEFLKNDKGIIPNEENVYRTIKNDLLLRDVFRYNTFIGVIESKFENEQWEALQRTDVISVRMHLMRTYAHFAKIPHSSVEDAIIRFSKDNKVSPPVEYFKSLVWDKKPRLNEWISETYNTPNGEYHQAVGSNWFKGMIKRMVQPGCKFDYVLVLEGRQGIKKSTSLAVVGSIPNHPSLHVETVFTPDNKDFFMLFSGKAIVEFSEGETLTRTESKHLKAIITMQFDKYRPPYERSPKDFPRQCVFAMTTNQEEYLKDETGNRRWLPVACEGVVNIEWLQENIEQIRAEAYHRVVTLQEKTYEFPEEETLRQQQMRQIADPKEEKIYDWYFKEIGEADRANGITTNAAFIGGVHKGATFGREMGKLEEMQIGGIFKNILRLEKRRIQSGGSRFNRYYPTEETKRIAPQVVNQISAEQSFKDF